MEQDKKSKGAPKNRSCKVCGKALPPEADLMASPFCSERCKLNDLSKWFGEQYRIASQSGPSSEMDLDDGEDLE